MSDYSLKRRVQQNYLDTSIFTLLLPFVKKKNYCMTEIDIFMKRAKINTERNSVLFISNTLLW